MPKQTKITHEAEFYYRCEKEFPIFTTPEGQAVLEKMAKEIVESIYGYFTQNFMAKSEHATYFRGELEAIRRAKEEKDVKRLGEALEAFKSSCRYV